MAVFSYQAVDSEGTRFRGTERAGDEEELSRALQSQGLLLVRVAQGEAERSRHWLGRRRASLEVTRSLASLLEAGVPLERALVISGELSGGYAARPLASIRSSIQHGDALHSALRNHPDLFPPAYVGVVRAGERSGDLAGAFQRLQDHLERQETLRSKIVSASIYPAILALAGGVAIVLLTLFVLPRFADLLTDAGVALPRSTRLLLAVSNGAIEFWPIVAFGPVVVLAGLTWWLSTASGRRVGAQALLAIPGVRVLRREALAGQFARLTGTLVTGGSPLMEALADAADSLSDPVAKEEVVRVRYKVREGSSLATALGESDLFPSLLSRLVGVGEEAGQTGEFLTKAADVFEGSVARASERLAVIVEPAMILLFGALVGFVALSLLQAIYGVNAGAL